MALTAKKVYAILKRQISDMEAKLNSPVRYRGTVATADLLPLNPDIGDMYNIESKSVYGEAGMNVAWNGVVWDTMGAPIDMSLYFTKEEAEAVIQRLVAEYFEKNPVKPGATTEQAQQIEQNKEDLNNILSPNLFNPKDAKENTAINQDDGTEMSFDGWLATGYIPVSKNDVLYFSSNEEPIPYSTGAFYDKNKQRVDSFGNPNNNNNITVTSDGYARFSFGTAPMNLQIEKGSRTTYVPYGELKVKVEVDNVKEDLGDIESKFEIETEAFVNKCSIIRNNTPNNFIGNQVTGLKQYFDFGKNATLTKIKMNIKASNDDTVVLEIATLDDNIIVTAEKAVTTEYTDVVFDLENIVIKEPVSVFAYTKGTSLLSYGLYGTPYENPSFSYIFPDGTSKLAFKYGTSGKINPTTSDNKSCLVLFFDYTSKIIKNIPDSISQNIDTTLLKSGKAADAKVVGDKLSKLEKDINFNNAHTIFVSTSGSDETGDGTEENPYATIYKANETITDSSETNKYEIIVKQGTYTDLQEKYSGVDGNRYQGVVCKPYVTYRSENILNPDLCVLKWDGADGYTKPVTDANCVNKCLFHIPTNSKGIYIKGFTFESKNTRYCMHIETTGSTDECDWHFENCVFNWGGRPDTTEDGTIATACIGTGYSMLEFGEFVNCIIKCTNTNHANHMVFQSHDNPDNIFTSIKRGEHLRFENCYFSIADGSDYAHIDLRTTKTSPIIPSFAEFINCSGIKLYVPSETYKKSFVCTEQHTIN